MGLFYTILLSLTLALAANTISVGYNFVRDVNGKPHMINPNPYSVIDAHLEPRFTAEADIFFRLYTRKNPERDQLLKPNETSSILGSNFNPAHPIRFLIHGWNQNGESDTIINIRDSYLSVGEFNVITVDWGLGAKTINYITARNLVGPVGNVTSRLIDTLLQSTDILRKQIYVIGHSLGAHIAGVVGKHQHGQLNTIVGLDPAGPLFSVGNSDILMRADAQYVETLCTNAGLLGFYKPLGDANFYPNGGHSQPGCGVDLIGWCAHARSWIYFAESVTNSLGFQATKCVSFEALMAGKCDSGRSAIIRMGGEPSNHGQQLEGIFLVQTNSQAPFGKG
ncbi:pancreatic triacylglycerol lipase-like [Armigeres subalbatus]|uniref:pancreatic triacylglycerol lipase-like n=1 Tax=Armigeres subalbatus TaxID=124917 RepID=UPI002ED4D860